MVNIVRYWLRRDTASQWAVKNPILGDGEVGLATDIYLFKIGDGITPWNDLDAMPTPTPSAENVYSPESYDPLPLPTDSNQAAIQDALDACALAGGGTVQMPRDRLYGWSGLITIPPNVQLVGTGKAALGLIALDATSQIRAGLWAGGLGYIGGIRDLHIDGDGTGDPDGLIVFQSVFAQMWNCTVTGGAGHNIVLDAAQNATILGCISTGAGDAALAIINGAGGYNFAGSHFTSSNRDLAIFDGDASANNAYPFGSAHLNFFGGILESYAVDQQNIADIQCGGAVTFWGTGFSVNGAVQMSDGCVVRVTNEGFPSVSTYVQFNSCTFNGGDENYPGVLIEGNQNVTFSGANYIQKHDPGFCVVNSGIPRISVHGHFDHGPDVTEEFATTGTGSLISLYNEHHILQNLKMPTARPTVFSTSLDTDAGHKFFQDANGKMSWNDGGDFGQDVNLLRRQSGALGVLINTQQVFCTGQGTLAQRPAAASTLAGAIYINTDTDCIDYCDGTVWHEADDQTWVAASTSNITTNPSGSGAPVGYTKMKDGTVLLRGHAAGVNINTTLFTLPAGFRPAYSHAQPIFTMTGGGVLTLGYINITTAGVVSIPIGAGGIVTFDGVTFLAA